MKNKLIKVDTNIILKSNNNLDDILKPLSRDILLFTTNIASTYRLVDKAPLLSLKIDDRLSFKHSKSKYDENEIVILNDNNDSVGYVAECDAPVFAKLMDGGKTLFAIVKKISSSKSIPLISIDIYLRDF